MLKDSPIAQHKSTRQWVHVYAARLLESGEEVRPSAIRELIFAEHGVTASPNLVIDEIKKFWVKVGPLLNARLQRPGIPDDVCQSMEKTWEVALNAAVAIHDLERRQLHAETHAAKEAANAARLNELAATERYEARDREIEGLRADKLQLVEQLQKTEDQRGALAAEHRQLSEQSASQNAQNMQEQQRLKGVIENLELQLNELRSSSQRELTALAETHQNELVKTQDFLMRETARVRDEEKAKTEKLAKELERERNEKDQLRQLRSAARDEASQLRGMLEVIEKNEEKLERQITQLIEQIGKLEQRNTQLSEQNVKLQTSLLEGIQGRVTAPEIAAKDLAITPETKA